MVRAGATISAVDLALLALLGIQAIPGLERLTSGADAPLFVAGRANATLGPGAAGVEVIDTAIEAGSRHPSGGFHAFLAPGMVSVLASRLFLVEIRFERFGDLAMGAGMCSHIKSISPLGDGA